jgi:hypothetical protein
MGFVLNFKASPPPGPLNFAMGFDLSRSLESPRDTGCDGRHGKAVQVQDGDETLTCRDCNREFAFTVGEHEFYMEKGYATSQVAIKTAKTANAYSKREKHSKVARDPAAGRGDNKSRNKVLKAANAAARKIRKDLRGNQGQGRK